MLGALVELERLELGQLVELRLERLVELRLGQLELLEPLGLVDRQPWHQR